jgi:hypothetical protein
MCSLVEGRGKPQSDGMVEFIIIVVKEIMRSNVCFSKGNDNLVTQKQDVRLVI